jgi:ubiquinone/menaquinone biosynthesis C-methylase UbiE
MRLPQIKIFDFFYRLNREWPIIYNGVTQLLSGGQWEKWQNSVFDDITGTKILEIGVGPGRLLIRMSKKGYKVTGIEIQKGMAFEARKNIKQAGLDVDILQQSVYNLPFKDNEFDCIVMTFVLAEIDHLDKAISEMKRLLKRGGKIIIVAGGMPRDRNIYARFLFRLIRSQTTLKLERDNISHLMHYGFKVSRKDFGPFNMINKIVAIKE